MDINVLLTMNKRETARIQQIFFNIGKMKL